MAFSMALGSGAEVRVKHLQGVWSLACGTRATEGTGIGDGKEVLVGLEGAVELL